jgi:hypothetical protein
MIEKVVEAIKRTDTVSLATLLAALFIGYQYVISFHKDDVQSIKVKQLSSEIVDLSTSAYWIEVEVTKDPTNARAVQQLHEITEQLSAAKIEREALQK